MYSLEKYKSASYDALLYFKIFVLPTSYFPDNVSIIAAHGLNFSVRNGKRCDPRAKSGEQKPQKVYGRTGKIRTCAPGLRIPRNSSLFKTSLGLYQLSYGSIYHSSYLYRFYKPYRIKHMKKELFPVVCGSHVTYINTEVLM